MISLQETEPGEREEMIGKWVVDCVRGVGAGASGLGATSLAITGTCVWLPCCVAIRLMNLT